MSTALLITGAIAYLACSVVVYGATFAYFQREYALRAKKGLSGDRGFAFFCALFGPVALFAVFTIGGFKHGLKFK